MLGYVFCIGILLHGVLMGRICLFDQFNTIACADLDSDWPVFSQDIHCVQYFVLFRHNSIYADIVCWLSTSSKLRAYACKCVVVLVMRY